MPPRRGLIDPSSDHQASDAGLDLVRFLEDGIDLGVFFCGAQLYVSLAGEVQADVALGVAKPGVAMGCDTIMPLYCTVKPVVPIAIASLVDHGRMDFGAELGDLVPDVRNNPPVARLTIHALLSHSAGLVDPPTAVVFLSSNDVRREVLLSSAPRPGWNPDTNLGYSEWTAWNLLAMAIQQTTGEPAERFLRTNVLDPLGADDTWLFMTDDEFDRVGDRIGINFNCSGPQPVPMHYEGKRAICTRPEFAIGYSNARDLGRMYEWLIGARSTNLAMSNSLTTTTQPASPRRYDIMMKRECTWGLGFMTALVDHHFGRRISASSFGHSGYHGMSFAFADPDHELVVALVLDGLVEGGYNVDTLRPQLIDRLYEEFGLC